MSRFISNLDTSKNQIGSTTLKVLELVTGPSLEVSKTESRGFSDNRRSDEDFPIQQMPMTKQAKDLNVKIAVELWIATRISCDTIYFSGYILAVAVFAEEATIEKVFNLVRFLFKIGPNHLLKQFCTFFTVVISFLH